MFEDKLCSALGSAASLSDLLSADDLADLRSRIGEVCTANGFPPRTDSPTNIDLQAGLLQAWATWAGDPAAATTQWLWDGAPAGVEVDFALDGVLAPVDPEAPEPPEDLGSDPASCQNYHGVESDPEALEIIQSYIDRGWFRM